MQPNLTTRMLISRLGHAGVIVWIDSAVNDWFDRPSQRSDELLRVSAYNGRKRMGVLTEIAPFMEIKHQIDVSSSLSVNVYGHKCAFFPGHGVTIIETCLAILFVFLLHHEAVLGAIRRNV
jgi:hypothetical protein